ncbi:cornifelin homolog [Nematolebias whitei]|uniref:cornifelin homolog n=1 Tax=Nematolebias whitei TaxID=451745 RepID=UPI0018973CDC|nr:cornifelin homolog [Nematolebias whitei]
MAETSLTEWDSGLFDCFEDPSTCCYGFWCGPSLACTVSRRLGENTCLPLCDVLSGCLSTVYRCPIFVPPAVLATRVAMRHKYSLKGSICEDILISCCCGWCSWCQMHRELKYRKQTPVVINMQPQAVVNMQPALEPALEMMIPVDPLLVDVVDQKRTIQDPY